jgi:hypothetical protein
VTVSVVHPVAVDDPVSVIVDPYVNDVGGAAGGGPYHPMNGFTSMVVASVMFRTRIVRL